MQNPRPFLENGTVENTLCRAKPNLALFWCCRTLLLQARDWDEYAAVREAQSERFQYVNEQGKGQLDWEDFRYIVEHRLNHRDTPADLLQAFKVCRGSVASLMSCPESVPFAGCLIGK